MPPSTVHVNGSVNLEDTESVMRALATHVPALRRIPDGETGERHVWILFQQEKFQQAGGLVPVPPAADRLAELGNDLVKLADGASAADVSFPNLGFADHYLASYAVFAQLRREGLIEPGVRFQVEYPSPLAPTSSYVDGPDVLRVLPSYEAALFADLNKVITQIPAASLAVQWDLPVEIGVLEMPEFFAVSDARGIDQLARDVARCIDLVPASIPVGMHLCYGDFEHRHFKEPESLATQVRFLNAVQAEAGREVSWCAFTVPQYARTPEFFAPLADLVASATELSLGIVPYHPEQQEPGTTEDQVRLIDHYLGGRAWGISTECGLANVDPDVLPAMLDLHTELLTRFGG